MKQIGVLARPIDGDEILSWKINDEVKDVIMKYGYFPHVILPRTEGELTEDDQRLLIEQINACEGVILQGGSDLFPFDVFVAEYLNTHRIPTLGICLGMQAMAKTTLTRMSDLKANIHYDNRKEAYAHEVWIEPSSRLGSILGTKVKVNSRHHDEVLTTPLRIVAYSEDGIIEGIEKMDHPFYIGVQWHPETMIAYDTVTKKLFDAFFSAVGGQNETKSNCGDCKGKNTSSE